MSKYTIEARLPGEVVRVQFEMEAEDSILLIPLLREMLATPYHEDVNIYVHLPNERRSPVYTGPL